MIFWFGTLIYICLKITKRIVVVHGMWNQSIKYQDDKDLHRYLIVQYIMVRFIIVLFILMYTSVSGDSQDFYDHNTIYIMYINSLLGYLCGSIFVFSPTWPGYAWGVIGLGVKLDLISNTMLFINNFNKTLMKICYSSGLWQYLCFLFFFTYSFYLSVVFS